MGSTRVFNASLLHKDLGMWHLVSCSTPDLCKTRPHTRTGGPVRLYGFALFDPSEDWLRQIAVRAARLALCAALISVHEKQPIAENPEQEVESFDYAHLLHVASNIEFAVSLHEDQLGERPCFL